MAKPGKETNGHKVPILVHTIRNNRLVLFHH
jgi:hypothetical protein